MHCMNSACVLEWSNVCVALLVTRGIIILWKICGIQFSCDMFVHIRHIDLILKVTTEFSKIQNVYTCVPCQSPYTWYYV